MGLGYFLGTVPFRIKGFLKKPFEKPIRAWDPTDWSMVLSNLLLIASVISFELTIVSIYFVYFIETAVLVVFVLLKMFFEKEIKVPLKIIGCAAILYGILLFLSSAGLNVMAYMESGSQLQEGYQIQPAVFYMGAVFFVSHLFSFIYHYIIKKQQFPDAEKDFFYSMFSPIRRVVFLGLAPWLFFLPVIFLKLGLTPAYFAAASAFILVKIDFDLREHFKEHFMINTNSWV
jgi:hypothetical protein